MRERPVLTEPESILPSQVVFDDMSTLTHICCKFKTVQLFLRNAHAQSLNILRVMMYINCFWVLCQLIKLASSGFTNLSYKTLPHTFTTDTRPSSFGLPCIHQDSVSKETISLGKVMTVRVDNKDGRGVSSSRGTV